MVEENSGADKDAGLVMVFKLPQGKGLRFDSGTVSISSLDWHTGSGQYQAVSTNTTGSGNWCQGMGCPRSINPAWREVLLRRLLCVKRFFMPPLMRGCGL